MIAFVKNPFLYLNLWNGMSAKRRIGTCLMVFLLKESKVYTYILQKMKSKDLIDVIMPSY